MRRTSSRFAFVLSLIVVAWGCDSSSAPDEGIALSLSTNALALAQGASQQITVTIQRSNFDQPVALSIQGQLPPGIAAEFALSSLPTGVSTTLLTVDVAGNAAPTSNASFTVRASGEGISEQTQAVTVSVAITGTYTLGLLEPELSVAQGGGGNATVLVTRNGGNAGDVALTVGTLPTGVTATFAQATTTTGAGSLIVAASSGVATGAYPITITSSSPGHSPDQTTTLSLVVVAPSATASVTMPFCAGGLPEWFAYRNEGHQWQQLSPSGSGFTFNATQRVFVAFAFVGSGGSDFNVYQLDRSELSFFNAAQCSGTRNYSGAVSGVSTGQSALIALGPVTAFASASSPSFSLEDVPTGALDLIATRGIITSNTFPSPDRIILRRGHDLPTGTVIPDLDFAAAEAFSPAAASATVTNIPEGSTVAVQNSLLTAAATLGLLQFTETLTLPVSLFFVPADKMLPSDLHELYADAIQSSGNTGQGYVEYTATVGDRSMPLAPALALPTITMRASGTYSRPRATFSSQTEYAAVALARFLQSGLNSSVFVTVVVSDAHHGGTPATWDLGVPDFSGVPGFDDNWMLRPGISTAYLTEAFGGPSSVLFGAAPSAGDLYRFAYRQSSVTTSARLRNADAMGRRPPSAQYFSR
jgi:hypothetical protein